jgi:azurin
MRHSPQTSVFLPLALALALTGCAPKEASPAQAPAPAPSTPAPAVAGPRVVELIITDANMKFSVAQIEAKPGEELKIVVKNSGSRTDMSHNFVLLHKEADVEEYMQASSVDKANNYISPDLADQVIVHTKLLGAGQQDAIVFKAPTEPGTYPYLCTFPGHWLSGMRGKLIVK